MIRLFLGDKVLPFEADIRELCKAFYPGEDFQIHSSQGIRLMETTQEEKNAFKRAKEVGQPTEVNKKSLKHKPEEKKNRILTEEGILDPSLFLFSLEITGEELSFTGDRGKDKSILKAYLYDILEKQSGRSLPWGDLTGIRPVGLCRKMREEKGQSPEILFPALKEEYRLEGEKAELLYKISLQEEGILQRAEKAYGKNLSEGYSLYINIPFCPTRCAYCSFLSMPMGSFSEKMPKYLSLLEEEMLFVLREMGEKRGKQLQSIYIGGGTPTALGEKDLEILLSLVDKHCFSKGKGAIEYTVEAGRPDSINREKLKLLQDFSVDRISINPQSFHQKSLDIIGRKHSVEEVKEKYSLARELGFDNINMDLILGLPGEHLQQVEESLSEILSLAPDSLTVHSLAVKRAARLKAEENHFREIYQAGGEAESFSLDREFSIPYLPSLKKRQERREIEWMMLCSMDTAEKLDLQPYYLYRQKNMAGNLENIGFAKEGKECLYNIFMMEEKHSVLGIGAGASSKILFPKGRIERTDNGKDMHSYLERFPEYLEKKRRLLEEEELR